MFNRLNTNYYNIRTMWQIISEKKLKKPRSMQAFGQVVYSWKPHNSYTHGRVT